MKTQLVPLNTLLNSEEIGAIPGFPALIGDRKVTVTAVLERTVVYEPAAGEPDGYAAPLRATHYARDAEYLRAWPSYVESTRFFFGPYLDLAAATARIWGRGGPSVWNPARKSASRFPVRSIP